MFRNPASRAVLRSLTKAAPQTVRFTYNNAYQRVQLTSQLCTTATKRPNLLAITPRNPVAAAVWRRTVTQTKWDKPDVAAEKKIAEKKLESDPEAVTVSSSVRPIMSEVKTSDA